MYGSAALSLLLAPSVLGAALTVAAEDPKHIRLPLVRNQRAKALGKQPKLLAATASTSSSSGQCTNLQTSSSATECAGFSPLDNGAYFGQISIGTDPVQKFNVTLDSGSSDLWIYSTNGTSVQTNIWVPTASKSGQDLGVNSSISYGDGSQEFYEWWNETVTFGALTATGVIAGAADLGQNNITAGEVDPHMSGLLGIGWPALNTGGFPPFVQVAFKKGLIKDQLYGFYAGNEDNDTNSEITLGSIDSSRYTGSLNYHNMTPVNNGTYAFFNVNVTKLTIGGSTKDYTNGAPLNMIVDTGTSFLVLPDNVIDAMLKPINGTLISNSTVSGGYSVPCENLANAPAITFVIDNINYTIPGDVWTHQDDSLAEAGVPCFAELYSAGSTGLDGLFGDTFFRQFYTVFDFANQRVGFAQSATGSNSTSGGGNTAKSTSGALQNTRSIVNTFYGIGSSVAAIAFLSSLSM